MTREILAEMTRTRQLHIDNSFKNKTNKTLKRAKAFIKYYLKQISSISFWTNSISLINVNL